MCNLSDSPLCRPARRKKHSKRTFVDAVGLILGQIKTRIYTKCVLTLVLLTCLDGIVFHDQSKFLVSVRFNTLEGFRQEILKLLSKTREGEKKLKSVRNNFANRKTASFRKHFRFIIIHFLSTNLVFIYLTQISNP